MTSIDGYTTFRDESELHRRLLNQEELILDVTEAISVELANSGMMKKELADKLGKTKGYISQILGGRNLTLRTLADIADALGCKVHLGLRRKQSSSGEVVEFPVEDLPSKWQSKKPSWGGNNIVPPEPTFAKAA